MLDVKTCRQRKSIQHSRLPLQRSWALRICLVRGSPPRAGLTLALNHIGNQLARLRPTAVLTHHLVFSADFVKFELLLVCSTTSRQPVHRSHGPRSVSIAVCLCDNDDDSNCYVRSRVYSKTYKVPRRRKLNPWDIEVEKKKKNR